MAAKTPLLAPRIIPVLGHELASGKHGNIVDVALAESLGNLGEEAAAQAEDVAAALERSPFGDVQITTFIALARVSKPESGLSVADLISRLDADDVSARARAFGQLRAMGSRAKDAVDPLLAKTDAKNKLYERVAAIDCLGAIDPASEKSIANFVKALSDQSRYVKSAGGLALAKLRPNHAKDAVTPLIGNFGSVGDEVARTVIETLHRIAPRDEKVVAKMVSLMQSATNKSDILYIYEILEALRGAGPAATGVGARLIAILDRKDALYEGRHPVEAEEIIGHTLVVLAEVGVPAASEGAVLAELERDEKFTLIPAVRASGTLKTKGGAAVKKLVSILEGKRRLVPTLPFLHDAYPELEAIRALGRIGTAAKDAIPTLEKISRRDTKSLSQIEVLEVQAARRALQQIRG